MNFKIGHGYDVHQLISKEEFEALYPERLAAYSEPGIFIGGVFIPYKHFLKGHSDADVLLHAIVDALLGAAGLEDIGSHFPPGDDNWAGMASIEFIKRTKTLIEDKGYKVGNIDCTLIAEQPKMRVHIPKMRKVIAAALKIELDQINIKATTTEKLGYLGRGEGIAAEAVCLLLCH